MNDLFASFYAIAGSKVLEIYLFLRLFSCLFNILLFSRIGHVLNEQETGYEHIFSWYEHSISIELKMEHVI